MTAHEMMMACKATIERGAKTLTFVLPGYSRGNTRRLFGRVGPKGEVVADTGTDQKPESLVAFDAIKVLAYLAAKGLINVQCVAPSGASITVTRATE